MDKVDESLIPHLPLCPVCGKKVESIRRIYCSDYCRINVRKDKFLADNPEYAWASKIGRQRVGLASEYVVLTNLLKKGIPVFKAVNWYESFDFVIQFEGKLWRLECKTGQSPQYGDWVIPDYKPDIIDILAVASYSGEVRYVTMGHVESAVAERMSLFLNQ